MVRRMKMKPNAGIWGTLLGACRIYQNIKLGKIAAEKLLELEPGKTSHYTLLSNMHAEAGRWDEVEKVRVSMEGSGAEKQPRCSWIELRDQIHTFLSDDPKKSRTSEIGFTLRTLSAQMRNTCHISGSEALALHSL
ncbi:Pentatricopeptide repeat [Melia azedarach]|nr:Pentatricopeptide repeat [Melia azedarach]